MTLLKLSAYWREIRTAGFCCHVKAISTYRCNRTHRHHAQNGLKATWSVVIIHKYRRSLNVTSTAHRK